MTPILQKTLPHLAWMEPATARLPGIQPIAEGDWLRIDDAFAAQMAERDRLIATVPDLVIGMQQAAAPAVAELYECVLTKLRRTEGYHVGAQTVVRPDGVVVALDGAPPLAVLGRLVQEDLCLMEKQDDEHVLTAAVLCFPSNWTLSEKLGKPLIAIHNPVAEYGPDLAKRVQRMFDAIRPEQPLWRMNYNVFEDPRLFHPAREADDVPSLRSGQYLRSERQCILRLPKTGAAVFSIHTYLVHLDGLSIAARQGLIAAGKLKPSDGGV